MELCSNLQDFIFQNTGTFKSIAVRVSNLGSVAPNICAKCSLASQCLLACNISRTSRWIVGKSSEIRTENLLLELSTVPKDVMLTNKNQLIKI